MNRLGEHRRPRLDQQRDAAVPAVGGAAGVDRTAGVALPVDARLGGAKQPLHLAELGVGLL